MLSNPAFFGAISGAPSRYAILFHQRDDQIRGIPLTQTFDPDNFFPGFMEFKMRLQLPSQIPGSGFGDFAMFAYGTTTDNTRFTAMYDQTQNRFQIRNTAGSSQNIAGPAGAGDIFDGNEHVIRITGDSDGSGHFVSVDGTQLPGPTTLIGFRDIQRFAGGAASSLNARFNLFLYDMKVSLDGSTLIHDVPMDDGPGVTELVNNGSAANLSLADMVEGTDYTWVQM